MNLKARGACKCRVHQLDEARSAFTYSVRRRGDSEWPMLTAQRGTAASIARGRGQGTWSARPRMHGVPEPEERGTAPAVGPDSRTICGLRVPQGLRVSVVKFQPKGRRDARKVQGWDDGGRPTGDVAIAAIPPHKFSGRANRGGERQWCTTQRRGRETNKAEARPVGGKKAQAGRDRLITRGKVGLSLNFFHGTPPGRMREVLLVTPSPKFQQRILGQEWSRKAWSRNGMPVRLGPKPRLDAFPIFAFHFAAPLCTVPTQRTRTGPSSI
ncbi:hypothetical protein FB451DRAFT_1182399 [Mycena latifolia]|nr:hypothetical protein FB451DRAFT_1182399 [Mycena latifolia]